MKSCSRLFFRVCVWPLQVFAKVALVVKKSPANVGERRDASLIPGWGRSPGGGMAMTPVHLSGESHGQKSLVGYSPWDCKESDRTEAT